MKLSFEWAIEIAWSAWLSSDISRLCLNLFLKIFPPPKLRPSFEERWFSSEASIRKTEQLEPEKYFVNHTFFLHNLWLNMIYVYEQLLNLPTSKSTGWLWRLRTFLLRPCPENRTAPNNFSLTSGGFTFGGETDPHKRILFEKITL